jgi:hypothetical protein
MLDGSGEPLTAVEGGGMVSAGMTHAGLAYLRAIGG